MTTRERAIQYAEEHRQIHVLYRDFFRQHPPTSASERQYRRAVGGVTHHEESIRRYDTILRALRSGAK